MCNFRDQGHRTECSFLLALSQLTGLGESQLPYCEDIQAVLGEAREVGE